jgi:membrane protein
MGKLLRLAFEKCQKDNTALIAAGLAFYTLLSLAPALWVVVAVAGSLVGRESARAEVLSFVASLTGPRAVRVVSNVLDSIAANGSVATLVGVISMFLGATLAFSALQDILNKIWNVTPRERGLIKDFIIKRLLSFAAVILVGILVIASLLTDTMISAAARFVPDRLPASELLLQTFTSGMSLAWTTLLFGVIYRLVPDRSIRWRDVWIGAVVTSLLFAIGKTLITLYLGHASFASAYGAAGSFVVFLLWVYYSAQIFLFGAEFTLVYAASSRREGKPSQITEAR